MNESFTLSLIFVATIALTAGALLYSPIISHRNVPLGVRVPANHLADPAVTGALAGYRKHVLIFAAISCLATAAAYQFPLAAAFGIYILIGGGLWSYLNQRRKIIHAKKAGQWFDDVEIAISGQVAHRTATRVSQGKYVDTDKNYDSIIAALPVPRFPWIASIASVVALVSGAAIVAVNWKKIPQVIPTHWGSGFEPDAWSDKSVGSVFFSTFVAIGTFVLMSGIAAAIASIQVYGRSDRSTKGHIRTQANLAATNAGLGLLTFLMSAGFALMQVITILPSYEGWRPAFFVGFLLMSLTSVIVMLWIIVRTQSQVDDLLRGITFGDESSESPDNDAHYKWGMFYYNPDDPAVMVDKRFGVGMDFNYATWQGKAFIAFVFAVICIPILLLIVL